MAGQWPVPARIRHGARVSDPGQVGYWVRRLTRSPAVPGLLPVRVAPAAPAAPVVAAISLRNERGWTLSLPGDVPASWLAELMRAL